MKKTIYALLAFAAIGCAALLTGSGADAASSVLNYFQGTAGSKDNPLILNGTVKVEGVAVPASITFTVGDESGALIDTALQFKDGNGTDMAAIGYAFCYLASDSAGVTPAATFEAMNNGAGGGTDGTVLVIGTNARLVVSESDGDADVGVHETSTTDYYMCCALPQGTTSCSGVIAFD